MLKKLFAALFRRDKKANPEPARPISRLHRALGQPRPSAQASRSVASSRPDDSLSSPTHPLNPLNPLSPTHPIHSVSHEPVSHCDDSSRSSSWGGSSDYSSSSCSSSSSDSGSSCSSSCD